MKIPVILGPTASGKSHVAMTIAQTLPVEIISIDSAQIYRGMDIGTAKPSREEQKKVPHHLIDIRAPTGSYSVGSFIRDATALITEIQAKQRIPLLVGGSMLYANGLFSHLHSLPPADPNVRSHLSDEGKQRGWPALHAQLAQQDPLSAARIAPTDSQRIQRALEVFLTTGIPLSAWFRGSKSTAEGSLDFLVVAMEPSDRSVLHQRIADRFQRMMQNGWVEEVSALYVRPDLNASLPAIKCVGYRQIWEWLAREKAETTRMLEAGMAATRQLAKRQLTWLKKIRQHQPCLEVDCLSKAATTTVLDAVYNAVAN